MLYEYECNKHGIFELILPMSESDSKQRCSECKKLCKRIPSLFASMPDNLWHFGDVRDGKEINSKSELKRYRKTNGLIEAGTKKDREDLRKQALSNRRDNEKKMEEKIRKKASEAFIGSGVVSSDGKPTKESLLPK